MGPNQDLSQKLEKINRVFDISKVLSLHPDKDYIRKYYQANKLPYSIFHSSSGRIHMAISRDGKYKDDDLGEAEKFIEKYIRKLDASCILDLATGRGTTSATLAIKYPRIEFAGLDLSDGQLEFAYLKAKRIKNYYPAKGDYHNLSSYNSRQFDIVFIVEALCYS